MIFILGIDMKIKVLILLSVIVLISCARKTVVQKQCDSYRQQHVEYHYDVCLTENGITKYPCFMKSSLVEELIEYIESKTAIKEWFVKNDACNILQDPDLKSKCEAMDFSSSSKEAVLYIKGGSLCDRSSYSGERAFCKASNPENGCDTLDVTTEAIGMNGGSSYSIIRIGDKWEVISSGLWVY
jgi:hypothetical protein